MGEVLVDVLDNVETPHLSFSKKSPRRPEPDGV